MPVSKNVPAGMYSGAVLQVVSFSSNAQFSTSSTSYVASSLAATITPTSSSSKVLIVISAGIYGINGSVATIYRNSTNLSGANGFMQFTPGSAFITPANCSYLDSPATTSATTYTLYMKTGASSFWLNIGGETSTITLMEIAA